jgi:hypothetical protein
MDQTPLETLPLVELYALWEAEMHRLGRWNAGMKAGKAAMQSMTASEQKRSIVAAITLLREGKTQWNPQP